MINITLNCTIHYEQGLCNSAELCGVIEYIKPDVIFEELSHKTFSQFYDEQRRSNLETNAIKMYLREHHIGHIPVDTYDRPKYYDEQLDRLYDKVTRSNMIRECRILQNTIDDGTLLIESGGFSYLNGGLNDERIKAIGLLTDQVLAALGNEELFRIRRLEKEVIDKREFEMLTNIYSYSEEHPYNQALFFIGSGHRESIIKKITEFDATQKTKLTWVIRDNDNYVPLSLFIATFKF